MTQNRRNYRHRRRCRRLRCRRRRRLLEDEKLKYSVTSIRSVFLRGGSDKTPSE